MTFTTTIRQLRDKANVSQQDVADAIGIARATYASLEADRRPPNLDEINALAEYYQVSPSMLIAGQPGEVAEPTVAYKFSNTFAEEIIPRDLDPHTNPEKLREVLLYVLEKVGAKPNVGETVLYKLLYFIDFDYYEKTGQSITGLTYVRNHYGPTPTRDFVNVVEGMKASDELEIVETKYFKNNQKKYLPRVSVELRELSASELQHINETLNRLSDKSASELSELSHYDTPWLTAEDGKPIDYRGVFYRTRITAVTELEDDL